MTLKMIFGIVNTFFLLFLMIYCTALSFIVLIGGCCASYLHWLHTHARSLFQSNRLSVCVSLSFFSHTHTRTYTLNLSHMHVYIHTYTHTLSFPVPHTLQCRYVLDNISDQTGMKGTGRWGVQEAAERSVPAPTIAAALDARWVRDADRQTDRQTGR